MSAERWAKAREVEQKAEQAVERAKPWMEGFARFGYAAKGVVYVVLGLLAAQAALGPGGKTTNQEGVLAVIARQPFGRVLLAILAVGLVGYLLWRLIQAVADPEHKGTDAKGIVKRVGYALSGLAYGALAYTAARMLLGASREGRSPQDWTAWFLEKPLGQWMVGLTGAIVIGLGINALYIAATAAFRKKLDYRGLPPGQEAWLTNIGRVGVAARGVTFGVIGTFLILAAWHADPNKTRGLDGALKVLAQQPYGKWLLFVVAAGLVAYGAFMFVEARYRRISVDGQTATR